VPKRTERASPYLSRIANTPLAQTPEYFNAMGICAATKGDYELARQYFSRCEALPAAQLNLQELTKLEQQ
jgi:Tfp pilus assembly protein PilF